MSLRRFQTVQPLVPRIDSAVVGRRPKKADQHYLTPGHKAWRALVIKRAGGRCEWVEDGRRCHRAEPHYRMVADHIVEILDEGQQLDPGNGQCLCMEHHNIKTARQRARRAHTG